MAETLRADYDAEVAQVFGEGGYEVAFRNGRVEPFAGLAYVDVASDVSDHGPTATLTARY